jgi:hypothetical protein
MHGSSSGRDIAQWLLPVFVARFLANGNRYDTNPNTRTRFTEEDLDELNRKYDIDSEQCKRFATKAYFNHKSEEAFRDYIGVPEPGKNVRHVLFIPIFPITPFIPTIPGAFKTYLNIWRHVAIFVIIHASIVT